MLSNYDAEQAVLSAMVGESPISGEIVDYLAASDFVGLPHQKIFSALTSLVIDGKPTDPISVADLLSSGKQLEEVGGLGYLAELATHYASDANLKYYARMVKDCAGRRRLSETGAEIQELARNEQSLADAIGKANELLSSADNNDSGTEARSNGEIIKDVVARIDLAMNRPDGQINGIASGYRDYDARLDGFKPGELYIMAARPGMGKTVVGLNIALNAAIYQNKRGLVFSVEMPDFQLFQRGIASIGDAPLAEIKKGVKDQGTWVKIAAAGEKMKAMDLPIIDKTGIHIRQLVSIARKFARVKPLDFILVDHIHLMTADGESEERRIASITMNLKALSKELNCAVLALAQLNRSVESRPDKRPMLSDLRGSGSIEQDADVVQFLYRPEYYWPEEVGAQGWIEVITAKFRDGEVGSDYLSANFANMRCGDVYDGFKPAHIDVKKTKAVGFDI